jgi:CubicO group peptidase (beta-lactamase class C family)
VEDGPSHVGTPGVAGAGVHDEEVVCGEGFGVRDIDTSEPVTAATVFQLASLSKPIGATALARLVGGGLIGWDDPVSRYDPTLRFADPWVTDRVTFADLYSHRSGLPGLFGDVLEQVGHDREQILSRLQLVPLNPFRAGFSYANFGMTAAGEAAAKAAGTAFERMIEEQLFGPAGMAHTSARHADFLAAPDRASIHHAVDGAWRVGYRQPDPQAPAGGLSSTVGDVATWVRLVLGGGMLDGEQLVDSVALGRTHAPHVLRAPPAGYADQPPMYGLGWNVETDHHGLLRWAHSGAFSAGASTTAVLLPQEQLGVVVLTNGMPQGVPEIVADEIVDLVVAGRVTRDWRAVWYDERFSHFYDGSGPEVPARPAPRQPDGTYLGTYANAYYGPVEVAAAAGGLALVLGPSRVVLPLTHLDDHTFTAAFFPEAPIDRTAIEFTVKGGRAVQVDIGDNDGPGTGRLTRT